MLFECGEHRTHDIDGVERVRYRGSAANEDWILVASTTQRCECLVAEIVDIDIARGKAQYGGAERVANHRCPQMGSGISQTDLG